MNRKTINKEITLEGIGLHTGAKSAITFKPTEQGYISFLRTDIKGAEPIKAALENVSSTLRGTNLSNAKAEVHTVEHVLSAAAALNITDLIIEMDGPEPPIMDGSSCQYAKALLEAELKEISAPASILNLTKKIEYKEGDITYTAEPDTKLSFTFIFLRNHPLVSRQEYTLDMSPKCYLKEVAPARTFGFEEEIAFLRANGLAKGGNIDNCVVILKDGYSVPVRFGNEMVRHKILDMVGDLKLTGKILGPMHITCSGGGHKTNVEFAKLLLKE
ncbi:MAG: UDP-3-O-acyl-N-acetylglucosamine deacetylase [Elusimicrobiota bacterium]|jgi:UDP-3-O-[3-hydroxymyristoyl] N-acetylglucosamine deacetylase|nr:UDP-3-O-acyl-N-acetylglucosamine deacetylase [Elusimicrobiota bacterium]